jgi:hypothetical protein
VGASPEHQQLGRARPSPPADERWLLSLFFAAGEVPFLEAHGGITKPVMHYWLPAYVPELNAC